jgi:hypothetical protein
LRGIEVGTAPHPSPANPNANRDWAGQTEQALAALGVSLGLPGRQVRAT